jgi:hypothetical protein
MARGIEGSQGVCSAPDCGQIARSFRNRSFTLLARAVIMLLQDDPIRIDAAARYVREHAAEVAKR